MLDDALPRALATLLVCVIFAGVTALAEAQSQPLGEPLRLTRPDQLELARRSTVGPGWEIAGGVLLVASTPIVAGFAALAAGPAWDECKAPSVQDRRQCERSAEKDGRRWGLGLALPLLAGGTGLITHGGIRLREIRIARRLVALQGASVGFRRGGLTLGVKMVF